jgi:hypothetical protein
MPDVGVDFTLYVFKLVQLIDGLSLIFYENVTGFVKGLGIAKPKCRGSVASDNLFCGMCHTPTFTGVVKFTDLPHREAIKDEAYMRLPRPFKNVRAPVNDSFSEVFRRKVITLQKLARLWLSSQQSGVAFEAGPFVERAVKIKEALGIAARLVECGNFAMTLYPHTGAAIPGTK